MQQYQAATQKINTNAAIAYQVCGFSAVHLWVCVCLSRLRRHKIFMGTRYGKKLGQVRNLLYSDALRHVGGDLTSLILQLICKHQNAWLQILSIKTAHCKLLPNFKTCTKLLVKPKSLGKVFSTYKVSKITQMIICSTSRLQIERALQFII